MGKRAKIYLMVALAAAWGGVVSAANVNVTTKYGKTGGIVGPLNQTSDKVNGRQICPADPTPGCDFDDDPGYNDNGTVDNPADDHYEGDLLVRTNDNFQAIAGWTWNGVPGGAEERATITGTLPETNGKHYYEWTQLPGSCDPSASSISDDRQTIVCVRKDFDKNDVGTFSEDLTFNVRVLGGTPSGTQPGDITFKVEAPNAAAKEDTTDGNSLTVTAAPRWNLQKSEYTVWAGKSDPDDSSVKGWIMDYKFYIESDEVDGEVDNVNPIVGNESMGKDATFEFTDDMGDLPPGAKVIGCSMNGRYDQQDGYVGSGDPITCFGDGCIRGSQYPERHILAPKGQQQISCTQNGNQVSVKVEHVDATLDHYPTKDYYGRDLPVNRAIAAIGSIYVFIPLDDVKKGRDGQEGTADDGEYHFTNRLKNFDPTTPTGHSNFGAESESEKDNGYSNTLYYSSGSWDKYFRGTPHGSRDEHGVWAYIGNGYRSGDGMVTKGLEFSTALDSTNRGGTPFSEDTFCDVIDAYRMKIQAVGDNTNYNEIKSSYTGKPEWPFRFVIWGDDGNYTDANGADGFPYIAEYATGYVDNSFLPSQGGDTHADISEKVHAECTDPSVQWTSDFDSVKNANGGLGVTKVRWRLKPGYEHVPGATLYLFLNHKVRSVDLATGQPMNNGDLIVNYAEHKFNGQEWSKSSYKPGDFPGTHSGSGGDRVIFTGPKVRIRKSESRSSASPGDEVTYQLSMSYTNDTGVDDHGEVRVTDVLPKDFKYKQGSVVPADEFGEPTIGTCADVVDINVTPCVDSENQVLIWDLGDRPVNAPQIPDLNYTVLIGAAANSGVNTNVAKIESPTDASPVSQRKADIGLSIDVPSSINIVKSTEENPDYPSKRERTVGAKDIYFLMDMRNGKNGEITDLDVIDILPFPGDGDDEAIKFNDLKLKRKVPTHYHGTMVFHEADFGQHPGSSTACDYEGKLKYYYTNADPKTINMAPTVGAANDVNSNDSIWCEGDENGPNGCTIPATNFTFTDNSQVTAVRARGPRMEAQAICEFRVHVTVADNLAGDNYSNSAGASATGITLPVLSNSLAVPIVGSSLGDRVWYDRDGNGVQDPGEEGVGGVNVYLLDSAGNPVENPETGQPYVTTTDDQGRYMFTGLSHGDYRLRFEPPAGYLISPKGAGGDSRSDSDVNGDDNGTDPVHLGVDERDPTIDLGLYTPVLSGHIFDDGNGDGAINGDAIAKPDGVQLYVTLLDAQGHPLSTLPVADDGSYLFDGEDGVRADGEYRIVLSTEPNATVSTLPAGWNHADGEQPANGGSGSDGNPDGVLKVSVGTRSVPDNDFGINRKPTAVDRNESSRPNPGGDSRVQVPALEVHDREDGTPASITVKDLPDNARLYYDGHPVSAGQVITNYDPAKLTVDPDDGDQTVVFHYTATDRAGVESDPATVRIPFTDVKISGHVFDDGNGDGNVNGTPIDKPSGTQLYATLVDGNGNAIASKPIASDGTYEFGTADGVETNGDYTVVLTTTSGNTAPSLPAEWNNTGEQPSNSGTGNDGTVDGKLAVHVGTRSVPDNDFGINRKPTAQDVHAQARRNPPGDRRYPVPSLPIEDREDGTPASITIKTLPDPATGTLYYDGHPVSAGQVITNYDPSKLTVDPKDGNQNVVFRYTTTDRAGVESDPATVTLPFLGEMKIGDRVWMDDNENGIQDPGEHGVPGVRIQLVDENGTVVQTTTSDANGSYLFTVERPGTYHVVFDSDHYYVPPRQGGDRQKDSDVDGSIEADKARTPDIELDWGDRRLDIDAGVAPTAHIGDHFWIDKNHDGVQDPGEPVVAGAVVELFDDQGNPVTDIHGNHSVVTDANGRYGFDVRPGSYRVHFTIPQHYKDEGYVFTDSNHGADDHDSDVGEDGYTAAITVGAGQNVLTLDAGIDCGCDPEKVTNDGGSALGRGLGLLMILMSGWLAMVMMRKEEEA